MTTPIGRCIGAVVLLIAMGRGHADEHESYDPHQIPKEQFAQQIRTIALRPTFLPRDLQQPDAIAARIESIISELLRTKGYAVVASAEHERVWQLLSQRAGGAYDPITGQRDEEKYEDIRTHTARELERTHEANAVLVPWISFSSAELSSKDQSDPVWFRGAPLKESPQLLIESNLAVGIYDVDGAELYVAETDLEWTMVFVERGYDVKPPDHAYSDTRLRKTLGVLFDPLVVRDPGREVGELTSR
jgi:hypothetical protein